MLFAAQMCLVVIPDGALQLLTALTHFWYQRQQVLVLEFLHLAIVLRATEVIFIRRVVFARLLAVPIHERFVVVVNFARAEVLDERRPHGGMGEAW